MKLLQEFHIPHESVNDEVVLIIKNYFKDGDPIKRGDPVLEFETSKALLTLESDNNGYVFYHNQEGDEVPVGSVVAEIYDVKTAKKRTGVSLQKKKAPLTDSATKTVFSRKAELLMIEKGIDKSVFAGRDFVGVDDVLSWGSKLVSSSISMPTNSSTQGVNKQDTTSVHENQKERIVVACPSKIGMEVIMDILDGQPHIEIVGYVVDEQYKAGMNLPLLDCNVMDFPDKVDRKAYDAVIIALSGSLKSMQFRKKVFDHYIRAGVRFTNLVSRKANISSHVRFGVGNIIGSGAFVGTGSSIGDNNFISYMATIGHHNTIGSNNLFAPGVMMSGLVEVGDDCILTTGINFIDKVKIGNRVILPLGYNVVSNLPDDTIVKMKN